MIFEASNKNDKNGNPAGGYFHSRGLSIIWQDGPVKENGRNGAFVEDVIQAAILRLEYFQQSKFSCTENQGALEHLTSALAYLNLRASRRIKEGVEGTYQLDKAAIDVDKVPTTDKTPVTFGGSRWDEKEGKLVPNPTTPEVEEHVVCSICWKGEGLCNHSCSQTSSKSPRFANHHWDETLRQMVRNPAPGTPEKGPQQPQEGKKCEKGCQCACESPKTSPEPAETVSRSGIKMEFRPMTQKEFDGWVAGMPKADKPEKTIPVKEGIEMLEEGLKRLEQDILFYDLFEEAVDCSFLAMDEASCGDEPGPLREILSGDCIHQTIILGKGQSYSEQHLLKEMQKALHELDDLVFSGLPNDLSQLYVTDGPKLTIERPKGGDVMELNIGLCYLWVK